MEVLNEIALLCLVAVALKSAIVGSSFNIKLWFTHGKRYTHIYNEWHKELERLHKVLEAE